MSDPSRHAGLPAPIAVTLATAQHRPVLERLWLLFRHDMSQVTGALPDVDGSYRAERLMHALNDPTWRSWVVTAGDHPVGFAIARSLDEPTRVLNSFFIVRPARRHGLGLAFAATVVCSHPGPWEVAYQETNHAAARFWPALAAVLDPSWRHEHRDVPSRPDLPPDSWISFIARGDVDLDLTAAPAALNALRARLAP